MTLPLSLKGTIRLQSGKGYQESSEILLDKIKAGLAARYAKGINSLGEKITFNGVSSTLSISPWIINPWAVYPMREFSWERFFWGRFTCDEFALLDVSSGEIELLERTDGRFIAYHLRFTTLVAVCAVLNVFVVLFGLFFPEPTTGLYVMAMVGTPLVWLWIYGMNVFSTITLFQRFLRSVLA
jgi:hypothetical protein